MGNPWMDFLAEERVKDENKDIPMLELAGHVRPKYDAWKAEHGIASAEVAKPEPAVVAKPDRKKRKTMKRKMTAKGGKKNKKNGGKSRRR
jgi:hypothetical protein